MSAPRLSADAKDRMLAEYVAGVKIAALAAKYGVHPTYPGILARRRKIAPHLLGRK